MPPSPLFQPFRALGYITDDTPFSVQRRGMETWVTVSVGKAWQVYNCAKLTLVLVGPQLKGSIDFLACKDDLTFAAVSQTVVECKRVHRSGAYSGRRFGCGRVLQLLMLGDRLLVLGSGQASGTGRLITWRIGQYDAPESVIEFAKGFVPTVLCHPDTYINKVLVGSESGAMQLWNFASRSLVYEFAGWGAAVRCLVSSPALDVVAAGLQDGRVVLHNVRVDQAVTTFTNASGVGLHGATGLMMTPAAAGGVTSGGGGGGAAAGGGAAPIAAIGRSMAVTSLSFRTGAGLPLLAAGGGAGVITLWDLERRALHTVINDAHDAPLVSLHFFPGEPLLMSSAGDNSVKQWVLDAADGTARLLRFRSGHAAPPTCILHYGEGLRLLSAGSDRAFRVFSVHQDQQSREVSQRHSAKRAKKLHVREADVKLPRVIGMDASEVRERDWCNVITAHEGDPHAYTWRLQHFTIGEHQLVPHRAELQEGERPAVVTCVALSRCGNFGIVGTAAGRVDRYNMQSGLHRGAFRRQPGATVQDTPATPKLAAHTGAVAGLAVDGVNRLLVSVGRDSVLRVWGFCNQKLTCELPLGSTATHLSLHAGSSLAVVAGADHVLRLVDVEAARLVRRFMGHRDRITSVQISSDCQWLLSTAMDGTLRVWDIPAGMALQTLRLGAPCTGVSLSPALDLLATTHAGRRGIYLWSNQALFGPPGTVIAHSDVPVDIEMPTITSGGARAARTAGGSGRDAGEPISSSSGSDKGSSGNGNEEDGNQHGSSSGSDSDQFHDEAIQDIEASGTSGADVDGLVVGGTGGTPMWRQSAAATGGAPSPLSPALVTMSLLPRAQVDSLLALDVIRARNKPLQPPKKPEAAPFFLPTVPGLGAVPDFTAPAKAKIPGHKQLTPADGAGASLPGWGDPAGGDSDSDGGEPASADDGAKAFYRMAGSSMSGASSDKAGSPVSKAGRLAGDGSTFLRLLRACAPAVTAADDDEAVVSASAGDAEVTGNHAEDFSAFMKFIRKLSPVALDRELRAMQVLAIEGEDGVSNEPSSQQGWSDLRLLLRCLSVQMATGANFEFCQALLALTLQVHGEAVGRRTELRALAQALHGEVQVLWARMDALLQSTRCIVDFFGNLQ